MKKFTGENLFPQNDVDGERPTASLYNAHLKTVRELGYLFRLYDCRHTFATRALESGVDLLTLSQILGHANLKMVSRYAHPSEAHKAEAIKMMDKSKIKNKGKSSLKAVKKQAPATLLDTGTY
jgi:integrase